MGNCLGGPKKSTAEIAPYDCIKRPAAAAVFTASAATSAAAATVATVAATTAASTVRLHGSPTSLVTSYVRFALLYKGVTLRFVPSETAPDGGVIKPTLQIGSETVTGSREILLRFIEDRFPDPPLMMMKFNLEGFDEGTPHIMVLTWLQHRSMIRHLERMVRWADDLVSRGGRKAVDPAMGSPKMELRKFGKSYSQLLEMMLEHAQMEERVLFPVLEMADRGVCKAANEEHARELPIMNGIKEDIKSLGVLDSGSPNFREALSNIPARLKSLQEHCKEHFEEEERDLLPLMEATELSREQQERLADQCFDVMKGTHSHLFNFFLEGLVPKEAMQYLDLIMKLGDQEHVPCFT